MVYEICCLSVPEMQHLFTKLATHDKLRVAISEVSNERGFIMAILTAMVSPVDGMIRKIEFDICAVNKDNQNTSVFSVTFRVGQKEIACNVVPDPYTRGYRVVFSDHCLPEPVYRRLMLATMKEFSEQERVDYEEEIGQAIDTAALYAQCDMSEMRDKIMRLEKLKPSDLAPWYYASYQ